MLQKSSMDKTLKVFFDEPVKEHSLMDISKSIGVAHTSVINNLKKLVKLSLIKEQKIKRGARVFPLYKSNLDNSLFKKYKLLNNLSSLLESGLVEFIEEKLTPKSMVLFGSYSRGEDIAESDIDLFIECKKEELDLKVFEKKLKRKIELHFNEKFSSYPNELKNNIANGIVLKGYLEVYK